jgi:hypothetical protein
VLLLLSIFSGPALAHRAPINTGGANRYKAARLTPEIYNGANADLSDLLIKDSKGENIPYFINSGERVETSSKESYNLRLINSYLKDESFYFDYKLANPRSADTISTSIEFSTKNRNFAKEVEVYGSYDDINWAFIQNDTIYSIEEKSKIAIDFTHPQKFTHFRLRLENNLEQISFDRATLIDSFETGEEIDFIESLEPAFSVISVNKSTEITIRGLRNLRLYDLTLHTGSMFRRNVRTAHGVSKELFNLTLNDTIYSDTSIPLSRMISTEDTYTLTIFDADDKPIEITGLTVRYFAEELVFESNANETYILEFGRDPAKKAPVYDIARYKAEILKSDVDKTTFGAVTYTKETPKKDYTALFNAIVIVVTLLLGLVIVLKLKKGGARPPQ